MAVRIVRVPRLKKVLGAWLRDDRMPQFDKKYLVSTPEEWRKFMARLTKEYKKL